MTEISHDQLTQKLGEQSQTLTADRLIKTGFETLLGRLEGEAERLTELNDAAGTEIKRATGDELVHLMNLRREIQQRLVSLQRVSQYLEQAASIPRGFGQ